ncbi:hypothetical protein LUR56_40810 [Streptomyces sp. MT29]|nr:hypothetical protein [Streptomyces sp. MT29]
MLTRRASTAAVAVAALLAAAPIALADDPDIDVGGCDNDFVCLDVGVGG